MILRKMVGAMAARSLVRAVGGAAGGPVAILVGAALPVVLPSVARRLGPAGTAAAAVGGLVFSRWLERRNARKARFDALGPLPTRSPELLLGGPLEPVALEGELRKPR